VTKDENSEIIIKIPQMILIHFLNLFALLDWIKSKIAPRVLVTIAIILIANNTLMMILVANQMFSILLSSMSVMMIDPTIAASWTLPEIILMIFANFLCFLASCNKSMAHRTDPTMRMIPRSTATGEMLINGVVLSIVIYIHK